MDDLELSLALSLIRYRRSNNLEFGFDKIACDIVQRGTEDPSFLFPSLSKLLRKIGIDIEADKISTFKYSIQQCRLFQGEGSIKNVVAFLDIIMALSQNGGHSRILYLMKAICDHLLAYPQEKLLPIKISEREFSKTRVTWQDTFHQIDLCVLYCVSDVSIHIQDLDIKLACLMDLYVYFFSCMKVKVRSRETRRVRSRMNIEKIINHQLLIVNLVCYAINRKAVFTCGQPTAKSVVFSLFADVQQLLKNDKTVELQDLINLTAKVHPKYLEAVVSFYLKLISKITTVDESMRKKALSLVIYFDLKKSMEVYQTI